MIIGNDVSKYQGDINWDIYKNNANFCIIKASEGNGYVDTKFSRNQFEARRVGLPLGYYHFARPDLGNSPSAEANFFLDTVNTAREGEVFTLDYEANWNGDVVTWCKGFLDTCANRLGGTKPLIYLNQSQVANYNWSPVVNAGYGLWLASYQADGIGNVGQWPFMAMQQTSSSQQVPGIIGNVDRDVFFGDIATFQRYGYHLPVTSTSTSTSHSTTSQSTSTSTVTTTTLAPIPPPVPQPPPSTDYRQYLLWIKSALNGPKPWWDPYLKDARLTTIAAIISQSGV